MSVWMYGCEPSFEVLVVIVGKGHHLGLFPLLVEHCHLLLVHEHFNGLECECLNQAEVGVSSERPEYPQEGLLVLVVALGGDVVVLESSLAVEGDLPCLHLPVLHVHLVAHHHHRNVFDNARQVLVPLRQRLVGDARCHVEHKNCRLSPDVVPLAQPAQLLLPCSVPEVEADGSVGGVEGDGADFHSLRGDVLLLELAGEMALDEGGLAHSSVSHQHHLELGCQLHAVAANSSHCSLLQIDLHSMFILKLDQQANSRCIQKPAQKWPHSSLVKLKGNGELYHMMIIARRWPYSAPPMIRNGRFELSCTGSVRLDCQSFSYSFYGVSS